MEQSRPAFAAYIDELLDTCRRNPTITGLVLMGSTADRSRADEWSDHDFAVIVPAGDEESLRSDLRWLPRHDEIVAAAREHHDGLTAIYRDGAVIEFAVTSRQSLAGWHANAWEVAYGSEDLVRTMTGVAAREKPMDAPDPARDMTIFLKALLVGVGRSRRGEALSASGSVRGFALDHLLVLLRQFLPAATPERLDDLDPRRRFELVHPEVGAELARALELPTEAAARELLRIADGRLTGWADYPAAAVTAVRERLGWG